MIAQLEPIRGLFEINDQTDAKANRPMSTIPFDWLFLTLGLLLTVGMVLDIFSHIVFGPDQSLFNEYHLLFYGSASAIALLLGTVAFTNMRNGQPLRTALPQGYGLGFLAVLSYGVAGALDLTGHTLYGFETGIEALTSPTHIPLFAIWALILATPVNAARARLRSSGKHATFVQSLPMLIAFGAMLVAINVPLMNYLPMGTNPWMIQELRPQDDLHGMVMGFSGMLLQTIVTVLLVLWLTREFRIPRGGFSVAFGLFGLLWTVLHPDFMPWLMFGLLGISLDIGYALLKPDATRKSQFMLFALFIPTAMWTINTGVLAFIMGGFDDFYYTGYSQFGSIFQAITMGGLMGYFMSLSAPQPVAVGDLEVANA